MRADKLWILPGVGLLYALFIKITGFSIPCMFHFFTGLLCPGCGITTMSMALLRLDFQAAFSANPFLFCTGPFLIAEIIYAMHAKLPRWNQVLLVFYIIALLVFGVVRNLV